MRSTILALAVLALLPAAAAAEPQHRVTLGPDSGEAKWDATGSGTLYLQDVLDTVGCRPGIHECYDTLVELKAPGKLAVTTSCDDPKTQDVDLQIFDSDASGKLGKELQESAASGLDCNESVTVTARSAHFYIVRVDYAVAVQGVAHAVAKFTAAPTAPVTQPPVTSTPSATAAKPPTRNVRTFSGTSSEGTAKVEVGLLQKSGRKCKQLTSSKGTFKKAPNCNSPTKWLRARGTTKWSLKLRKALRKGSYVMFVRASDAAGRQGVTKGSFRVK